MGLRQAFVNELDDVLRGSPGKEYFGDARFFQGEDIWFGDDAAEEDDDVVHAFVVE